MLFKSHAAPFHRPFASICSIFTIRGPRRCTVSVLNDWGWARITHKSHDHPYCSTETYERKHLCHFSVKGIRNGKHSPASATRLNKHVNLPLKVLSTIGISIIDSIAFRRQVVLKRKFKTCGIFGHVVSSATKVIHIRQFWVLESGLKFYRLFHYINRIAPFKWVTN